MSAMPLPTNTNAIEVVLAKVTELSVLPQVVHKIVDLSGADDASTKTMEQAIEVDPGFSARVLAHANSAYYSLPRRVTSIREAVMFLGFKAVRQLAMTVGAFELFVGKNDAESLRRRGWWRTSIESAHIAKWLAEKTESCRPDDAYTAGLLHLTGKTLLDRFDPSRFENVGVLIEQGSTEFDAEALVYGCHHVEIGAAAALRWGFPPILVDAFDYTGPSEGNLLRECVALGNSLSRAHVAGDGWANPPTWAIERLGLGATPIDELLAQSRALIEEARQLSL
jgi:HD-like signal output (HDOD) protein